MRHGFAALSIYAASAMVQAAMDDFVLPSSIFAPAAGPPRQRKWVRRKPRAKSAACLRTRARRRAARKAARR